MGDSDTITISRWLGSYPRLSTFKGAAGLIKGGSVCIAMLERSMVVRCQPASLSNKQIVLTAASVSGANTGECSKVWVTNNDISR